MAKTAKGGAGMRIACPTTWMAEPKRMVWGVELLDRWVGKRQCCVAHLAKAEPLVEPDICNGAAHETAASHAVSFSVYVVNQVNLHAVGDEQHGHNGLQCDMSQKNIACCPIKIYYARS